MFALPRAPQIYMNIHISCANVYTRNLVWISSLLAAVFAYFYYCHWGLYDPRLLQNQHVVNRQIGYCGSVLYNDIVAMLCGVNLPRIKGVFLRGFLGCFVFFLICVCNVCVFAGGLLAILINYSGPVLPKLCSTRKILCEKIW